MIVYSVVNYRGRADMGKNNRYMSNNEKEEGEIMIIIPVEIVIKITSQPCALLFILVAIHGSLHEYIL